VRGYSRLISAGSNLFHSSFILRSALHSSLDSTFLIRLYGFAVTKPALCGELAQN
jgi:hypothetical protein